MPGAEETLVYVKEHLEIAASTFRVMGHPDGADILEKDVSRLLAIAVLLAAVKKMAEMSGQQQIVDLFNNDLMGEPETEATTQARTVSPAP